jgi:hypothetical protein
MSIGNLKDTGNQGNNMPWQWKMLQGLQAIADATSAPLTCVEDSVTICNANIDAFTFTNILGVGESLNVNIANTIPLEVNINEANDSILIYGYDSSALVNVPISVDNSGVVAIQDNGGSITVDGGTGLLRTTGMIRPSGTSGNLNTVANPFYSVSVANVGSNPGTVLGQTIKSGEVLNFSADAINNYFNSFAYDATGTDFIIIYVA